MALLSTLLASETYYEELTLVLLWTIWALTHIIRSKLEPATVDTAVNPKLKHEVQVKREGMPEAISEPPKHSQSTPLVLPIRCPKINQKREGHTRSCTAPAYRSPPTPRSQILPVPRIPMSLVPMLRIPEP